jgi:cytochrome c
MSKSLILALAGVTIMASSANAMDGGNPAEGEKDFKKCQVCHMIGPDAKNRVGPNLNGVVGRQIGTQEGYNYGPATKARGADGTVWTEELLFEYLVDPKAFIGGTSKMPVKFPDEQFRRDVVTYIAQFDENGQMRQ